MRVSTSVLNSRASDAMNKAYATYSSIINKINSNKNFTQMSENIQDSKNVVKMDDQLAKLDEYAANIKVASNRMEITYDTLGDVTDELDNINSLVVQAANATTSPSSAKAIAAEVQSRVSTIVNLMNTKYLDEYIFSGNQINSRTFEETTDPDTGNITYTYQGSPKETGDRNITIAEGITLTYNVTGDAIFTKDENGNDFYSAMAELNDLLTADELDHGKIREKLEIIQDTHSNVVNERGKISAKSTKLDTTESINTDTKTTLTGERAELAEVDITKASTDLASALNALQASYLVGQKVLSGISLIDYI